MSNLTERLNQLALKLDSFDANTEIIDSRNELIQDRMDKVEENMVGLPTIVEKYDEFFSDLKTKIIKIESNLTELKKAKNIGNIKNPSFADILKGGGLSTLTNDISTEIKNRSLKELNVIISGLEVDHINDKDNDNLKDFITDFVHNMDNTVAIESCAKLFSKRENKYTTKVLVTLKSKEERDNFLISSKRSLKGKNIFVNPDLTQVEMELEYK